MSTETVQIRRYPNRRFYDRAQRCYVTLPDIEAMVRSGQTIEVQDSRTGEDITRQVLTQILLERHPDKMALFPVPMLHSLLQANDLVLEFWRGCLRQSLAALEGWEQRGATALPLGWFSSFFPGWFPGGKPTGTGQPELDRRVAALEERIGQLEAAGGQAPGVEAGAAVDPLAGSLERLEHRVENLEQPRRRRS